jgi:MoaA/NifB/PqqE/SkfB family radical SAM enzyme
MQAQATAEAGWRRPVADIRTLHVILSLRCNYRCEFCFQPNFHDDLAERVWREALAPVYPGLDDVVLHGGEPTAVPRFVEFCDLVRSVNDTARFSLFTNGHRFAGYWPDLMLARGRFVNFSLNAATRKTYAEVNRRDNYDAVLETVRGFAGRRQESGSAVALDFSFVITAANLAELSDFLQLAAEHDVDRVRFFFDLDRRPPDLGAVRAELDRARSARERLPGLRVWGLEVFEGRMFGRPVDDEHLESTGCRRTFNNLYVGVDAAASFCNFLHWRPIGNLLEQSVDEVWNSPAALEQRRAQGTRQWDFCVSAYCGPTERATGSGAVTVPVGALRSRIESRGATP